MFYVEVGIIIAALQAFAFWRGRRYERSQRRAAHGGYITIDPRPYDHEWDWPASPPEHPLNARIEGRL